MKKNSIDVGSDAYAFDDAPRLVSYQIYSKSGLVIILQWIFLCLALATILTTQAASACVMQREKPEELKQQAQIVVEALIMGVDAPRQTFRSVVYLYNVSVKSVERGSFALGPSKLTYEDLLMHRRGNLTVCPLKHGSGIEQGLKPNTSYRMYVRSATDTEILLAEEIPSQKPVVGKGDFSFVGTVKEIKASPLKAPSLANWVVVFSVDKATAGEFSKPTFSIRVHSPAKSGLEVGKQYSVQAKWNGTGYDVDEFQWMRH